MVALPISQKRLLNYLPEALIWPPLRICQVATNGKTQENALTAFERSLRDGAEGIAVDVQLSARGVPMVTLDAPLNRKTASPGVTKKPPEHTASLTEVLRWVRDRRCMAFVAMDHAHRGAEATVVNEIARAKVLHLTRVIACDVPGLRRLGKLDPKVHLGLRFSGRTPALRQVKALGAEVLLPHLTAAPLSFIQRAHRAQLLVIPWAVDSPRQMRRNVLDGVDGIVTNHPAKLTEAVASLRNILRAARQSREQPGFSVFSGKNSSSHPP